MAKQQSKKRGIVYILTNGALPGCLKIGKVESVQLDSVRKRIRSFQSASPYPYRIEYVAYADDVTTAEKDVQGIHDSNRMKEEGGGTEWFKMGLEPAIKTLDSLKGLRQLTSQELAKVRGEPTTPPKRVTKAKASKQTSSKKPARRPRFTFDSIGVPVGAELTYVSNSKVTARVVSQSPPRIVFNGEHTNLTAAAKQIEGYPVSGPQYWKYNGKTIYAISTVSDTRSLRNQAKQLTTHIVCLSRLRRRLVAFYSSPGSFLSKQRSRKSCTASRRYCAGHVSWVRVVASELGVCRPHDNPRLERKLEHLPPNVALELLAQLLVA